MVASATCIMIRYLSRYDSPPHPVDEAESRETFTSDFDFVVYKENFPAVAHSRLYLEHSNNPYLAIVLHTLLRRSETILAVHP